jgi:hypothetical protein
VGMAVQTLLPGSSLRGTEISIGCSVSIVIPLL